jgi:hypothetical protein
MFVLITIGLNLLNAILGFMGYLCYGGIVVVLGSQLVNAATSSENFGLLKSVANFVEPLQKPVIDFLHAHIPCIYGKFDAAPAMIGLVFLLMCMGFDHLAHRVRVYRLSLIERRKLAERQEAIKLQGEAYLVAAEAEKDPSKREKLIEVYARTKKMIEEQKKHMAFLSIDVVNSTGMKNGEDPVLAERDFRNFRKLVERIINEHGMLKTAWTPDGMMIGFATVQDAVGAAKTLIRSTGEVLFDESVPMEEMAHGVIDVAGHMQKYASENTIYVGGPVAEEVGALGGFRPAYKQVDGLEVYEWRPAFEADSRA